MFLILQASMSHVEHLEQLVKLHDDLTQDIAVMQAAADNVMAAIHAYKNVGRVEKSEVKTANTTKRDTPAVIDAIVHYFVACENRRITTAPLTDILKSRGVNLPEKAPMASVGRILSFYKDTFERIPPKTKGGTPEWQLIDAVFQQHRAKHNAGPLCIPINKEDLHIC
jgi:hypothetical protein